MGRIKGLLSFSSNFEPQISGALDARSIVQYKSDLYLLSTWRANDGFVYIYKGMVVSVTEDTIENNGLYILIDEDYTLENNWSRVGGVTGNYVDLISNQTITSGIKEFIESPLVPIPTLGTQAVNKDYADSLIKGEFWDNVKVVSTDDVLIDSELEEGDVIDGYALIEGDRVVLIGQSIPSENGLYVVPLSGAASRAIDASTSQSVNNKKVIPLDGSVNKAKFYFTTSNVTTLDVDPIHFAEIALDNAYVYIAYAIDASGTGFSLTPFPESLYIGILNTNVNIVPTATDFIGLWKPYVGQSKGTGIFVTNVTPATGGKNVVITYNNAPNQASIKSILTDDTSVNVTIEWDRGLQYQGTPTVNGIPITTYASRTSVTYTQTITINVEGITEIVCEFEGTTYIVEVEADNPPIIQTAIFRDGYPGTQTELKLDDIFNFQVIADIPFDRIEFEGSATDAYKPQIFTVAEGTDRTVTGLIANRGTTAQLLGTRVRVRKPTGAWSLWHNTVNDGLINGTNVVNLNNLRPTITFVNVVYPGSQQALKDSENATVNHTVTNFDTISYTSPNLELSINNSTTYEAAKTVTRIAGTYNIVTNNFRVTAFRAANDSQTVNNTIVRIAHTAATINITTPAVRLRSGGNDGTSVQLHTITIVSNQQLLVAPTLDPGGPTIWAGSGFIGGPLNWTRSLQVHDDMPKGAYSFSGLSATNLAGIETTTINSGATFELGGFVSRQIPLAAFAYETEMNVEAVTYTKVALTWSFSPAVTVRAALNSMPIISNSWCLDALNVNPTKVRILDNLYNSSSQESTITIEEIV